MFILAQLLQLRVQEDLIPTMGNTEKDLDQDHILGTEEEESKQKFKKVVTQDLDPDPDLEEGEIIK